MPPLTESFVIDAKGNRVGVFLPIKEYNKILEDLEDLQDIKAFDKATSRKQEFVSLEKALKEIELSRKKRK
jgi:hypothetical protein